MSSDVTAPPSVLVVDDDQALGTVLIALLRQAGFTAEHVPSGQEALTTLEARPFELVISDLRMPGMDGMRLLKELKTRWPDLPVVMLTAHGTVPLAVEAMKAGAREFVLKPFDRDELLYVVRSQLKSSASAPPLPPAESKPPLIGRSKPMRDVFKLIEKAARSSANVLVRGESGTGKELVARAIHEQSRRHKKALITVHCGALPNTLIESELFGYERGAFTGASRRKPGRVELAEGGTLFLDEIGDTTGQVQVKLLRLLQERSYERLGGTESLTADVRFVAATHRDLDALIQEGTFRADLFYRLDVVPIWLPPLRDRGEDIPLLAESFCKSLGAANDVPDAHLSPEALNRLAQYPWPGNVRELQNLIERLIVLSDAPQIRLADVERELSTRSVAPGELQAQRGDSSLASLKRETERAALEETLKRCDNNRTQAARILGVSRRTLYNKLEEYGIS